MHQVSTRQRTEQFSGVCELLLRKNTLLESESVGEFQKLGADQFESLGSGCCVGVCIGICQCTGRGGDAFVDVCASRCVGVGVCRFCVSVCT